MWLYRFNHAIAPVVGLYWRLGMDGAVESIPRDGPLVVASNHASFLDPWFLGMAFPRLIRYLVTRDWFYKSTAWKTMFTAFGTFPVRSRDPKATVADVCEILARGDVVGMFPEGRIANDGRIRRFRSGLSFIAASSGAPVLPVGIRGSFGSLPRHRRFPRPVRVTIHIGEPAVFPGSPTADPPSSREVKSFQSHIFREICSLSGQEDRMGQLGGGS